MVRNLTIVLAGLLGLGAAATAFADSDLLRLDGKGDAQVEQTRGYYGGGYRGGYRGGYGYRGYYGGYRGGFYRGNYGYYGGYYRPGFSVGFYGAPYYSGYYNPSYYYAPPVYYEPPWCYSSGGSRAPRATPAIRVWRRRPATSLRNRRRCGHRSLGNRTRRWPCRSRATDRRTTTTAARAASCRAPAPRR